MEIIISLSFFVKIIILIVFLPLLVTLNFTYSVLCLKRRIIILFFVTFILFLNYICISFWLLFSWILIFLYKCRVKATLICWFKTFLFCRSTMFIGISIINILIHPNSRICVKLLLFWAFTSLLFLLRYIIIITYYSYWNAALLFTIIWIKCRWSNSWGLPLLPNIMSCLLIMNLLCHLKATWIHMLLLLL